MVSTSKLSQVNEPSALIHHGCVVHWSKLMIDARGDARVLQRRADRGDERRDFGGACRIVSIFEPSVREVSWSRQGKHGILFHWDKRVDKGAVQNSVRFIRNKEHRLLATRNQQRSAKRKSGDVFLKRQSRNAKRIISEAVGIQRFVPEKVKRTAMKLLRAAARAQIHPTSGRRSILRRELIRDHLHLGDRFERRLKTLAGSAIVVVIEAVDRQVIGVSRCTRQ